jgi:hypothetical protein
MSIPKLHIRPGNPDSLDLPWDRPIQEWTGGRTVDMPMGIHRHPVVFVAYDEGVYAIKELSARKAAHEFALLRGLEPRTSRSARPAGVAERPWLDPLDEGAGAVITRYVDYAFPYRELLSGGGFGARREQLLDAFAGLLVELHVAGCFWGDCSLSNVLYRYDAGAIETIMVDAETSELYDAISDGRRLEDLEIMRENIAGGMGDIAALAGKSLDEADLDLGSDITKRYEALWEQLNTDLLIAPNERFLIRERIQRLNDLGFAVDEIDVVPAGESSRVRIKVQVGGRTFHSNRLRELTGIDASENQARIILTDLARHEAKHGGSGSLTEKAVTTMRWRAGRFEPFTNRIAELRPGFDPIQGYADFLNYRYRRSVETGHDIESAEAFEAWIEAGLPGFDL